MGSTSISGSPPFSVKKKCWHCLPLTFPSSPCTGSNQPLCSELELSTFFGCEPQPLRPDPSPAQFMFCNSNKKMFCRKSSSCSQTFSLYLDSNLISVLSPQRKKICIQFGCTFVDVHIHRLFVSLTLDYHVPAAHSLPKMFFPWLLGNCIQFFF